MSPKTSTDRLMTLAELSTYLHMGRNTVLKLVDDKKIPGLQIEGEWRFRVVDIDKWLAEQLESEYDDFEDVIDGMELPLGDLMPQEAIIHDMRAPDSLGAIEELAARAYNEKWLNDKPWFIGSLVERETLASTAMEGGIAFLHTRSRDTSKLKRPFVVCGRSYDGIDFGAPDGKPTFIFFLLGLKYDKLHLPILGRLARLTMRHPTIVSRLRATTSPIKMRATLLKLDAEELSATSIPKVAQRAPAQKGFDPKERLRQIMKLNAKRLHEQKKEGEFQAKEAKKEASRVKREETRKAKAEAAKEARAIKKAAKELEKAAAAAAKKEAAAARKPTVRKAAAAKKPAVKKAAATKKPAAKKAATTKKPAAKKAVAKKPAVKKAAATKKPATKKPATKKPATKKPATKKPATKKPATKKPATKK
ncbi:MAG: PTS transporter subunit EIIA, partial [Myxococcales bacterium]|nr:PTS transporter subunit EIIA [Myxococcales bacterium]